MSGAPVTVEGTVARIVYQSDDSSYTVLRLEVAGQRQPLTVVGRMFGIREGARVRVVGEPKTHPRFGPQLEASTVNEITPQTAAGIERYLASGLIPGIGPEMARRIVARFGEQTLTLIDEDPGRLGEVAGIGPVRVKKIAAAWSEQRVIREVHVFLQAYGVSPALAAKIYKRYGDDAIDVVKQNPYRLALDVWGVGFKTADRIAQEMNVARDSPLRAVAGLLHVLGELTEEGHCYVPRATLLDASAQVLEVEDRALLEGCLAELARDQRLVVEDVGQEEPAVFDNELYSAEVRAADRLRALAADRQVGLAGAAAAVLLAEVERDLRLELAAQQRQAVLAAVTAPLLVITGGPGVGKTTTLRTLLELLRRLGRRVLLGAPTGRAAKRMTEATGEPAQTLHRLLAYDPRRNVFQRGPEDPLDCDVVCVDESSMVDIRLFAALLDAVPEGARLVLIGDIDQLPSVGPGSVLGDVIASGVAEVVRLTEVFRQAAESRIVAGAHKINHGELPLPADDGDLYFIERNDPEAALATIRELVAERIPRRFGLDARADLQVLAPMHRGVCGAQNLNTVLQDALNPSGAELARGSRRFRAGDRVMQVRNDYDREVWNGDIGRILSVDAERGTVVVDVEGREVPYEAADLDELHLAYACSVHKAQGSEFPAVVIPLLGEHYMMLQRNLLYTALTRARKLAVIVGSRRALTQAVRNDRIRHRHTHLARRLAGG